MTHRFFCRFPVCPSFALLAEGCLPHGKKYSEVQFFMERKLSKPGNPPRVSRGTLLMVGAVIGFVPGAVNTLLGGVVSGEALGAGAGYHRWYLARDICLTD